MSTQLHQNLPEFFKVYIPHHSSDQMLVPYAFAKHLERENGGKAQLTGPNGKTWEVELVKEGNVLYFKEGWKVFVKDNVIVANDFMFFEYHGNLVFKVKIYDDRTMCEKELPVSDKVRKGGGNGENVRTEKKVKVGRKVAVLPSLPIKRSDVGCTMTASKLGPLVTPKVEELPMNCSSVRPFFIKKINMHNRVLRIPAAFTKKNSLHYEQGEKVIVRIEESSWTMKLIWNISAYVFSGGWCPFVRENKLKPGDTCKFELVNRLEMVAHISYGGIPKNMKHIK